MHRLPTLSGRKRVYVLPVENSPIDRKQVSKARWPVRLLKENLLGERGRFRAIMVLNRESPIPKPAAAFKVRR